MIIRALRGMNFLKYIVFKYYNNIHFFINNLFYIYIEVDIRLLFGLVRILASLVWFGYLRVWFEFGFR